MWSLPFGAVSASGLASDGPVMLTRSDYRSAAVAPPGSFSRCALSLLRVDVERVEAAAATHLRGAVAVALAGVRTRPTPNYPDGIPRQTLIRGCGRMHAFKVGDGYDLAPVCCRQRACPSCARARARRNGAELDRAMRHRGELGACFLFATLTQPKLPRWVEQPRASVRRIVDVWQRLTNGKTACGRMFHRLFAGGLRTTETTYAQRGDEQRNGGGAVQVSGYHAHLHVLLEVRAGVSRIDAAKWLADRWCLFCDGASASAQCVRPASVADARQLCKYVTKPLEDVTRTPAILRELFGALDGLRLLQAFGDWVGRAGVRDGWRQFGSDTAPAEDHVVRLRGPEIGDLLRVATDRFRAAGTTDRVPFKGPTPGHEIVVSAAEAWNLISVAVAARSRGS